MYYVEVIIVNNDLMTHMGLTLSLDSVFEFDRFLVIIVWILLIQLNYDKKNTHVSLSV